MATPIGNARDLTFRALDTLRAVDVIACEDTRVTSRLLAIYGVETPMVAYHEHNAARVRPRLLKRLEAGESVALASDAGTPLVSDPGYKLVRECIDLGVGVTAEPGASAVLTALQLSGLPTDRFFFAGFPPSKQSARERWLLELTAIPGTLIVMESPKRLAASLSDMARVLGDRPSAVTRELTKRFEEARREPLAALAAHYAEAGPPKGEVTVVVGPPSENPEADGETLDRALLDALVGSSVSEAARAVADALGLPKKRVYTRALELRGR